MEKPASRANRAAGVALVHKGIVLLGKRLDGPNIDFGGYWSIFGGRVEKDENPMACAARELHEETGVAVHISSLKFIKIIRSPTVEFVFYVCEVDELITPTLNFEHTEHGWFKIDGLKSFPEKIDEEIVDCLFLYQNPKELD